jgi:ribosomal protein S18 acetylase RimI-like enzyme
MVRNPKGSEIAGLASIWFDGWQEAHRHLMPEGLARHRTLESFHERLAAGFECTRVVGPEDRPTGFCMTKGAELHQLYVLPAERGSGCARALLQDAEARLRAAGAITVWLACAIGNERAARFYAKNGWTRVGTVVEPLEVAGGAFPLAVWRYEKRLRE